MNKAGLFLVVMVFATVMHMVVSYPPGCDQVLAYANDGPICDNFACCQRWCDGSLENCNYIP